MQPVNSNTSSNFSHIGLEQGNMGDCNANKSINFSHLIHEQDNMDFYDARIKITSFPDFLDKGWNINFKHKDSITLNPEVIVVGLLGCKNSGKTHFLKMLLNQEGSYSHTDTLSIKIQTSYMEEKIKIKKPLIYFLDTSTPEVDQSDETSEFIENYVIENSDGIIIGVTQYTKDEEELVNRVGLKTLNHIFIGLNNYYSNEIFEKKQDNGHMIWFDFENETILKIRDYLEHLDVQKPFCVKKTLEKCLQSKLGKYLQNKSEIIKISNDKIMPLRNNQKSEIDNIKETAEPFTVDYQIKETDYNIAIELFLPFEAEFQLFDLKINVNNNCIFLIKGKKKVKEIDDQINKHKLMYNLDKDDFEVGIEKELKLPIKTKTPELKKMNNGMYSINYDLLKETEGSNQYELKGK